MKNYDEILAEYLCSVDQNLGVSPRQLIEQYPEHAERLRQYFQDADVVEQSIDNTAASSELDSPDATKSDESDTQRDASSNESFALPLTSVGRFELENRLGSGGFGHVFLATDTLLHRKVAIKLPRERISLDPQALQRVEREIEATAALQHPHIVPIFEAGDQNGLPYIVSEYVEGPNLAEYLRQAKSDMDPQTAVKLVMQLTDAVQHSHTQGILHRDIKPGNVLLSPIKDTDDEFPFDVRLTDFGLARFTDLPQDATVSGVTRSGVLLGTPKYVSPEQAMNSSDELTIATDIYSLGVILFELLTGEAPFDGPSEYAVLKQVCEIEARKPSSIRSSISPDLDAICSRCLQKMPADRYASAADLHEDLQRVANGQPALARLDEGNKQNAYRILAQTSTKWILVAFLVVVAVGCYLLITPQSSESLADRQLVLDGQSDHVIARSMTYDGTYPVTLEAWVKPESYRTGVIMTLGGLLNLNLHHEGRLSPSIGALREDEMFHLHGNVHLRKDEWTHVAGIYDGDKLSIFINGTKQPGILRHNSWTEAGEVSSVELYEGFPSFELEPLWVEPKFSIGANPWAEPSWFSAFEGQIDEVRVSRCVRYVDDFVPERYFEPDNNTVALYDFDSLDDNVVRDSSGNGHHGLLVVD